MYPYNISFFVVVVLVVCVFRFTSIILDKLPNDLGKNAWFLFAIILIFVILIMIHNPYFFKKHTNGNKIPDFEDDMEELEMKMSKYHY